MLFNSFEFVFAFFPIVLIVYYILNYYKKYDFAKVWLIFSSLYFYSYLNKSYLIIISASILFNYFIGQRLHSRNKKDIERRIVLAIGITFNLLILGYFKYYDFFIENINLVFKTNVALLHLMLPLGISFFTFQQLSFVVDSYHRKSLKYSFLDYCLFVTFFPQLIAGPIVLPSEMLPQFESKKNKKINYANLNKGIYIFSIGLAKKIIIADSIALLANAGFDNMHSLTGLEGWITSLSYTMQIYFDFSGYCDMAIGIGLMFNILIPLNFNSPYKSLDIQEFWKRWHITLGRFFSNYLYIPLGGNRKGGLKTLRNLWIVFLISGLWHGAGWTFILWGGLHGLAILIHRIWKKLGRSMNKYLGWFITFNLINILWVFFRATSLNKAILVLHSMFNFSNFNFVITKHFKKIVTADNILGMKAILMLLIISIIISLSYNEGAVYSQLSSSNNLNKSYSRMIKTCIFFVISVVLMYKVSVFLYFNF